MRDGEGLGKSQFWKALVSCNNVDLVLRVAVETVLMAISGWMRCASTGGGLQTCSLGAQWRMHVLFSDLVPQSNNQQGKEERGVRTKGCFTSTSIDLYSAPHRFSSIVNHNSESSFHTLVTRIIRTTFVRVAFSPLAPFRQKLPQKANLRIQPFSPHPAAGPGPAKQGKRHICATIVVPHKHPTIS